MKHPFLVIALFLFSGMTYSNNIVLPGLISDGMVLQRDAEVNLWGKALPGKTLKVTTSWNDASYRAIPDAEGNWKIPVTTGEAGGPYEITIRQGGEEVRVSDILLGEVWLCSGQSNMQMPVMGYSSQPVDGSFEALLDAPSHRNVRLLIIPRQIEKGRTDFPETSWQKAGLASASQFSAIGWFFATGLEKALGVPVGIIEADWGGTRIEAWMTRESVLEAAPGANDFRHSVNSIQALYDNIIWPVRNYTVKGFLWYQGESNKENPEQYAQLMSGMVSDWRALFPSCGALPFYYVMVAPFKYDNGYDDAKGIMPDLVAPMLWEAQTKALGLIPNSDMAVTTDIGDAIFIHPSQKKKVADRLLMLAMHGTYQDAAGFSGMPSLAWRGPIFRKAEFVGPEAYVDFDSPCTLCPVNPLENRQIDGFEIAGSDRVFHKADAYVKQDRPYAFSNTVVVSSPEVSEPVAVRYCFHNVPSGNLTNTIGLPAVPFRTDDWNDR